MTEVKEINPLHNLSFKEKVKLAGWNRCKDFCEYVGISASTLWRYNEFNEYPRWCEVYFELVIEGYK